MLRKRRTGVLKFRDETAMLHSAVSSWTKYVHQGWYTTRYIFIPGVKNCLGFIVSLEDFSLISRCHYYRLRAANFDLCSALMAIEQLGFFSVPSLLWLETSVYNSYIRGPVTLTPIVERLAVELSLLVFTSVAAGIRTPNFPLPGPTL